MSGGSQIEVAVRLGGRLGGGHHTICLPAGATVRDLLAALGAGTGHGDRELAAAAVSIDGVVVGGDRVLRDRERVALILPVAGG